MITRRNFLAGSALSVLAGISDSALGQVVPPPVVPPLPVVSVPSSDPVVRAAGGAAIGKTLVISGMIYIIRGIIGTQVIAFLYKRQATLLEFLLWPFPTPKPGPAEQEYLELALQLGNLPRFQEDIRFRIADGRSVVWPVDTKAMRAAIRFWSRRS